MAAPAAGALINSLAAERVPGQSTERAVPSRKSRSPRSRAVMDLILTVMVAFLFGEGGRIVGTRRVELGRARKAAGYTQEALAEALHVDRCTVIRWEAGQYAPVPYLWPKLARLLGVTPERLQELMAAADLPRVSAYTVSVNDAVASEDMKRRTLMKWGVTATAAAGLSASTDTTNVGMADVRRLERAADRLHGLDQQHGGDSLWRAALAQAEDGMRLLEYGTYRDSVGHALLMASGRLQDCAGWLALDAGQHEIARSCFAEALTIGRQAGDAQTETLALNDLAFQSDLLGRPREALRYSTGAEQAAAGPGAPNWLGVLPQLRLAIANSLVGNASDADRAVSRARRLLDRENDAPEQEWTSFLSDLEIAGIEARCAVELGRPAKAERLLERVISGYSTRFARNLASWRVCLARARLDMGAVDGAVEATHRALDDVSGDVASHRVLSRLGVVVRRLAKHPEVAGVEHAIARYQMVSA